MSHNLTQALNACSKRIEQQLGLHLAQLGLAHGYLAEAMRYGVLNGGKRLRPFLIYATAEALGGRQEQADSAAVAMEMIHSYSLVHDDLPAMDNDSLRRGKPTCHIAFDEATAILAGDGLLTAAFEVLTNAQSLAVSQKLELISLLAKAAGGAGMVAGQSIDLSNVGKKLSLAELEAMHGLKTGALIIAAVQMGAVCAKPQLAESQKQALSLFAKQIGLAFQVWDDVLDIEGSTATLGKNQGKDQAQDKPTYPALLGLEAAKNKAYELVASAKQALTQVEGDTRLLAELADYIVSRNH